MCVTCRTRIIMTPRLQTNKQRTNRYCGWISAVSFHSLISAQRNVSRRLIIVCVLKLPPLDVNTCLDCGTSSWLAAINNLLCDLFIWANSAGSLTPITLPVECLCWTTSQRFALKSIVPQGKKMLPCSRPVSTPIHGAVNMLLWRETQVVMNLLCHSFVFRLLFQCDTSELL